MARLPIIKAKELPRILNRLGFFKFHQVGSHAQFKHADGKKITVPIHSHKEIGKKTLRGIINDLDITVEELIKILKRKNK